MRKFDYLFLENGMVPANLVDVVSTINVLNKSSSDRKDKFKDVFTALEKIAKVESVKGSNAIEGIITSDQRIKDIVNGSSAPVNHNEAEIAGYRDCLNQIHNNYMNMEFNEETILSLHKQLLGVTGLSYGGTYKEEDNVIMEIDSLGNKKVRFTPMPAKETKQAMEQLILAYKEADNNYYISKLLLIPCVILDFLCIHPFRDGNGRMSRLLSLLLLYKAGFDAGKYISFEEEINKYKNLYYTALQKSSIDWMENKNDYFYFVDNFLLTLARCYKTLDMRFAVVNSKKITKTNRIEATIMNSIAPLTKTQISFILPDVSPTTIEAVLSKLLKEEKIQKIGNTRNTMYIRK